MRLKFVPRFLSILLIIFTFTFQPLKLSAQNEVENPRVLLVTAHPDDDALFAATVFKITHLLGGKVDLALATNGEGGYKYSTLGEFIYDDELDTEEKGREKLPGIRKMELMKGGEIVGIRNYFFFEQVDNKFDTDISVAFDAWDVEWVRNRLHQLMQKNNYNYVFTMLPTEDTHGHHKAAAILAMQAAKKIDQPERPIVLATTIYVKGSENIYTYEGLEGFEISEPLEGVKPLEFDRTQRFGFDDRLNYKIIGNWVIAEHKSQGTMQMYMSRGDVEQYWYLEMNGRSNYSKAKQLFEAVNKAKIYDK